MPHPANGDPLVPATHTVFVQRRFSALNRRRIVQAFARFRESIDGPLRLSLAYRRIVYVWPIGECDAKPRHCALGVHLTGRPKRSLCLEIVEPVEEGEPLIEIPLRQRRVRRNLAGISPLARRKMARWELIRRVDERVGACDANGTKQQDARRAD